jgi:putative acetyltransferase
VSGEELGEAALARSEPAPERLLELLLTLLGERGLRAAVADRRRVPLMAAGAALVLCEHQPSRRARTSILLLVPCSISPTRRGAQADSSARGSLGHTLRGVADLRIERVSAPTDEIRQLVAELDRALSGPYLPEQHHALALDRLFDSNVRFFVARVDGVAVGCGGVAFYDGFAEVKRMFTRSTVRRQGVATALLRRLEAEAQRAGYSRLRLETGVYQAEAIEFYVRAGFTRCAAFGQYVEMSPEAIETSVFYEKTI